MRLIDADALDTRERGNNSQRTMWWNIKRLIDAAPTIDPASLRPKGEWVEKKEWHHGRWVAWFECSRCGERDDNYEMYEMMPFCNLPKFCPECGADMRAAGASPRPTEAGEGEG